MNTHATIEELLFLCDGEVNTPLYVKREELLGNGVFCGSRPEAIKEDLRQRRIHPHVEIESNTSTVALRVVGGDEKGNFKSETVKIWSQILRDSDPRETALARTRSIYKRQTRPLVREGAPQKQDRNCQTLIDISS
jgi:hypothetical protein